MFFSFFTHITFIIEIVNTKLNAQNNVSNNYFYNSFFNQKVDNNYILNQYFSIVVSNVVNIVFFNQKYFQYLNNNRRILLIYKIQNFEQATFHMHRVL